jgi:hypothetical protein
MNFLRPWKENLKSLSNEVVGSTQVTLHSKRYEESTLGNFVADSMVHWVRIKVGLILKARHFKFGSILKIILEITVPHFGFSLKKPYLITTFF